MKLATKLSVFSLAMMVFSLPAVVGSFLFSSSCLASAEIPTSNYLKNFEISLGAGEAFFRSNDGSLPFSSTEIDTLSVTHTASNPIEKIGVGYHFFYEQAKRKFFTDLLAEINIYHVNSGINGRVFQYDQSSLNNYSFQAPLSSTRIMLDFKPTLFTVDRFSPYITGGIGLAWNKISYNETIINNNVPSNSLINLDNGLNRRIAYDVGFGINYHATSHFNTSLEYLYNQIGALSTSKTGSGPTVYSPASFLVHSQNVLINFGYQF